MNQWLDTAEQKLHAKTFLELLEVTQVLLVLNDLLWRPKCLHVPWVVGSATKETE